MEGPRDGFADSNMNSYLLQRYWLRRLWQEQETIHYRMMEEQRVQQQNGNSSETFFRPWEHPPPSPQANIAVVRPLFHSHQNILSRVRENLHKKLLRGNHIQYQQSRYQYQQPQQNHHRMDPNVNHSPESVILNRPLILETTSNNEISSSNEILLPKTVESLSGGIATKNSTPIYSSNNDLVKKNSNILDPETENSNDLIICDANDEQSEGSDDDEDDIDCESISSESSSSSSQPLDLRTTKIPYSSTAEYEITVIRSLSPVPNKLTKAKETKERKSKKLKTKRRICTACNRTYLKTKNLRWHFKSKLHLKRVSKLGIDDPANQPDTWYKVEHHDTSSSKNFLLEQNIC